MLLPLLSTLFLQWSRHVSSSSTMACSKLTHVQDQIANEVKYVKVGSEGADNRREPDRVSTNGEEPDGLGQLVRDAINQLTA